MLDRRAAIAQVLEQVTNNKKSLVKYELKEDLSALLTAIIRKATITSYKRMLICYLYAINNNLPVSQVFLDYKETIACNVYCYIKLMTDSDFILRMINLGAINAMDCINVAVEELRLDPKRGKLIPTDKEGLDTMFQIIYEANRDRRSFETALS